MGYRYRQLTLEERCAIALLYGDGQSLRQIASALDRAPSTVARELTRNASRTKGYDALYAWEQARSRRWKGSLLARQPALRSLVLERLAMGYSPEQTAGRLALEQGKPVISHESIYRFIYAQIRRTNDGAWRHYLPRAKFKRGYRGRKGGTAQTIAGRIPISERPPEVAQRQQFGHWESDLLMFSNKKDNLLVAQERVSRFVLLALQPDKLSDRVIQTQLQWFKNLPPPLRKSLTQDNGTEFARHQKLTQEIDMKTYFCNPHSPWQKGGIENMNGRLRRYLPLNTNLSNLSTTAIAALAHRINTTPRKCLGYQTPAELFSQQLLHFKCESTYLDCNG
jgi:transposase, IS30 family